MGKTVWLINTIFGIGVGGIVALWALISIFTGFTVDLVGWLIGGALAVVFGVYQWKKYKNA